MLINNFFLNLNIIFFRSSKETLNSLNNDYRKMVKEFTKAKNIPISDDFVEKSVIPKDLSDEAIPGNIRKANTFLLSIKRFAEFIKRRLRVQHVVIESSSYFMRDVYKNILLDQRSMKLFHERLVFILRTLEVSNLAAYKPIVKIATLATLVSTYEKGFALIFEPFNTKTNVYDPHLFFACLDASIAIKPIFENFQSVIITSGVFLLILNLINS